MATEALPDCREPSNEQMMEAIKNLQSRVERLEEENEKLREELDSQASVRWDSTDIEDLEVESTSGASLPVGRTLRSKVGKEDNEYKALKEEVSQLKDGGVETNGAVAGERDRMLPAHRMYADILAGNCNHLDKAPMRAAEIFGLFVERDLSESANEVDPSGQKYTISSGAVEEALVNSDGDAVVEENQLASVKKKSRSEIVGRVMRDVARLTKHGECECDKIDECGHSAIEFVDGRPRILAVAKKAFNAHMRDVYGDEASQLTSDDASDEDVEDLAQEAEDTFNTIESARGND